MPQNTPPIALTPGKFVNIVGATAGQQIKASKGTLLNFSINTAGTSSTLVLYDGTSTSGIPIGTWSTTAQVNFDLLNWTFATGLFAVVTGTNSNITVGYV